MPLIGISQEIKEFDKNPEEFIKQFFSFLTYGSDKEERIFVETFKNAWIAGNYSENQKNTIIQISNDLLQKKARNFPHFYNYIQILEKLKENQDDTSQLINFSMGLSTMLTDKKVLLGSVGDFLENIHLLLKDSVIYQSGTMVWKTNTTHYRFLFDSTFRISFQMTDMQCFVGKNFISILNTKGVYNPIELKWHGKGGIVHWDRANLEPKKVYVQLKNYLIDLKKPHYSADSVVFTNRYYFTFTMEGSFEDKVMNYTKTQDIVYPKFASYKQVYEIKNIFEKIDYKGGFTMQGEKFIGSGTISEPATLNIYRKVEVSRENEITLEDRLFINCKSIYFAFRENNITGKNTMITLYLDTDSIYHPGLLFRYFDQNKEVNLIRNDDPETLSKRKYYDSYHRLDLEFELLSWKLNEPMVYFTMQKGSTINMAVFSSENYFNYNSFIKIQGISNVHPYAVMRSFIRKIGRNDFTCEEYASYIKASYSQTRSILIGLFYQGVIDFNLNTDEGIVKQRLFDMLQFNVGQKDYDQIDFISTVDAPKQNAVLNLKTFDLQINGVPKIQVSDSQNVIIFPTGQQINMSRNRNFVFAGTVQTGLFTFYGQKFRFVYDSFKIVLGTVDSLKLKVKVGLDNWGRQKAKNVTSLIEDISGEVYIDDPSNKSGVKRFSQYPVFESKQPSYVYYDKSSKYKNIYKRANFYFKIAPYTIDSLNSFSIEGFGYKGTLFSASILEPLEETLILQKDYSLGMTHQTGDKGMDVYKKNGKFFKTISLSNQGLIGDGKLIYINSTTESRELVFFPDSANAIATSYLITEKWENKAFPKVTGSKNLIRWKPYQKYMLAQKKEQPFEMYGNSIFHGSLKHEPLSLTGQGRLEYKNADFSSASFVFDANKFNSELTHFVLRNQDRKEMVYELHNVDAQHSYLLHKAEFINKKQLSLMFFYPNQYKAYGEQVIWYEDKQELGLSTLSYAQSFDNFEHKVVPAAQKGEMLSGSLFISTHKKQDSLNFISPVALYNINNYILTCSDVKLVYVADATIYPSDNKIIINPQGKMQTLKNAVILADRNTSYHRFYETNTYIMGRLSYTSEGYYDYKDENGAIQKIHFTTIGVDSLTRTYASGKIIESDNFSLSLAFKYMGKVYLLAPEKYLRFTGSAKLNHECSLTKCWFQFDTVIDPNNIMIPLPEKPRDINNNLIYSGVYMSNDSIHLFPAFLSYIRNYADKPVITAKGVIVYSKKLGKYLIGSSEKVADPSKPGNLLSLHGKICNLAGEGIIEPGLNTRQVKYTYTGKTNYDINKKDFDCQGIMMIDFLFNDKCLKMMADTFLTASGLQGINIGSNIYQNAIQEILGPDQAIDFFKELRTFGTIKKLPEPLQHTLVLADLSLKWNDETNSYKSQGKIGVGSILDVSINRMVDGYVELVRKRSGDILAIYLEIDKKHWFFFHYQRGLMQSLSSGSNFNQILMNQKASERQIKANKPEDEYLYFLAVERKKNDFIKQFLKTGQAEEEPENDNNLNKDQEDENQE